ncbi:MAG: hypothetical protein HYT79_06115 [Elusimicrobia bacterium]|nr:hypothetical protein [Elusimicrobiota bacterium]
MSLRNVHIFFILTALALCFFLTYWSGRQLMAGEDGWNFAFALVSSLGLVAGIPYLTWFIKKTKAL